MTVAADTAAPAQPTVWDALARALSPIEERPQVVAGIEAAHQTTRAGTPYVVIRNPVAQTYLKLDPREYDLLPLMDGTRTVKALVVAYYQRHGVLALPRIAGLVRLLRANHFLTVPPLDAYAALEARLHRRDASAWAERLARGFLLTEFPLPGMDRLLGAWYRAWGHLFFTRPAVWLGAIISLLGPVLFFLELQRGRYGLLNAGGSYLSGFLLLSVLAILALLIHEVGHGLAVKHCGRYVRRAGLLIYYGFPTGYVDTTDIWMAPRGQRLLVSFAGPWTGLVLGGLCALGAVLLPTGPVGAFLFAWGFIFMLDNLFNFNPLLELDGYYMLVDLVEKPMLRARALRFVRGPLWTKLRARTRLTGEERFFAGFGLASALYSGLAVFLAIRAWELRIGRLIEEAISGGDWIARVGVLLLVALVTVPLALALLGRAGRLLAWARLRFTWLGARATARRYRAALAALRAVPVWATLPEARLLEVARRLRAQPISAGTEVVRQGDPGDRFYVIARGRFEVLVDGVAVGSLGRGDYFGERALLRDAPRAATVLAAEPGLLFWLDQAAFHALLAQDLAVRSRIEAALSYRADVAEMPLFRDLAPHEVDLLLAHLVPLRVPATAPIIRQGDPGDRFYIVRTGTVAVERDGRELARLGPGDGFGEIALLLNVPRTTTVRATTPTELLALDAAQFRDLLLGYFGRASALERLSHLRLESHKRLDQLAA